MKGYGLSEIETLVIEENDDVWTFPIDRYYWIGDPGHIWFLIEEKDRIKVGLDEFGAVHAGPIISLRIFPVGRLVKQGKLFGTLESGKWIGPLRVPLTGLITDINQNVIEEPTIINDHCYDEGWIITLKPTNLKELNNPFIAKPNEEGKEKLKKFIKNEIEKIKAIG